MNSRSGTVTGIHKRWLVAKRVILMVAWLSAVAVVVNADDVGEDDGTTTATSTPTSTATTSTLCERTMEDDDGEEEMQRTHWYEYTPIYPFSSLKKKERKRKNLEDVALRLSNRYYVAADKKYLCFWPPAQHAPSSLGRALLFFAPFHLGMLTCAFPVTSCITGSAGT